MLMDYRDIPLLAKAGFETGFSGTSWFGKDRNGHEWQVYEHEEMLHFRTEHGKTYGPGGPMHREDFDKLFGGDT